MILSKLSIEPAFVRFIKEEVSAEQQKSGLESFCYELLEALFAEAELEYWAYPGDLAQGFCAFFLFYAFYRAGVACGWAFVGSEADALAILCVDYAGFDPAEVASVEAEDFVVLDVGGCFATPEVNCFFVRCDVGGWLPRLVVEGNFHRLFTYLQRL